MANTLVSIQIIPKPKDGGDVIPYVDAAIAVIEEANITYEVHPLETTMEGELTDLFAVIEQMNKKMIEMGSSNVISQVKVLYQPEGITRKELTEKYR